MLGDGTLINSTLSDASFGKHLTQIKKII